MERKCYLHIGTTKTGTSTIQSSLHKNRSLLRNQGIQLLPNRLRKGNSDYTLALSQYRERNHLLFNKSLKMLGVFDAESKLNFDKNTEEIYSNFINKTKKNILITDEQFFSRSFKDNDCILRTVKFLKSHNLNCKIIVYLRSQESWILSDYIQNIKGGGTLSLDDYISKVLGKNSSYDLDKFINILEGTNLELIIRPYKRVRYKRWNVINDFYKCIAKSKITKSNNFKKVKDKNVTYPSKRGIDDIIFFNKSYRSRLDDKLKSSREMLRVMNNLSSQLSIYSAKDDPLEISSKNLSLIRSRFEVGNNNLVSKYPILKKYLN